MGDLPKAELRQDWVGGWFRRLSALIGVGLLTQDGRVVLLNGSGDMREHIRAPQSPARRVLAQKSIFVRPPAGYVEPADTIIIPRHLKVPMLDYLQDGHGISTETIYNDLFGFIRSKAIHREASEHFSAAISHIANDDYPAAIAECTRALDRNPQMVAAYHARGVAHRDSGDYKDAIADFSHAIDLVPSYVAAYNDRGDGYSIINEYDEAIADFDRVIDLVPNSIIAYINRGTSYHYKGDYNRAIADYDQAIALAPDNADFYGNLGESWLHLSDWGKARANLIAAREMGADIVTSFRNDYENVADFEQQTGLTVPDDIAEMLGG